MSRSAAYTHGHDESVLRSHRWRTAENSCGYLLPHLRPGLDLLDIGSGPATITADLARLVAPGRVHAVEMNDVAASITRTELERQGIDATVHVSDAHRLDLRDGLADVTHAHQVLQHVGDPVQVLREMARVTKPGGLVAARDSDYAAFTWWPLVPALDEWLMLYRAAARTNGGEPDAGRRLLSWAHAAGLNDVEVTSSTWCFSTPEDRAWWGGMWADRILTSDLAGQVVRDGLGDRALLQRISDGWREWAAHPDGWFSILHGELLARV
ncbi:class I SAM-dependent methyltransferase [Luteipulveratus mongoliensis]|uniref:Methyltransferase type 11 domain-containing protein n=1 Tax=Luteipulveratus mongoliensis TaxID=571913 RepID=A0A0K1JIF3_9MICO|nr:methyltransferase domain-containing protein [Luteipulveratus mongoliensis]AKU16358.1 hypothetical protein VV02_11600 [Luteipulveratus mongoliensis]